MALNINILGVNYPVPTNASDTNWAATQVAFEQAVAAGINSVSTDLLELDDAVNAPPTWAAVTFENLWQNFNAGTDQAVQYAKDSHGWVEIRGSMSTGAPATIAFTLPIGFRPPKKLTFNAASSGGIVQCTLDTAGRLTVGLELGVGNPTTKTSITFGFSTAA